MANGYFGFRPVLTSISGAFWGFDATTVFVGANPLQSAGSGSVTQKFEVELWVYDAITATYTKLPVSSLPAGFQILSIALYGGAAAFDFPDIVFSPGDAFNADAAQVTSWSSTVPGWDSSNPNLTDWSVILEQQIEITFQVSWNGVSTVVPVILPRLLAADPAFPGYPEPPTNPNPVTAFTGGFYLWGEWDDQGGESATPGAIENVEYEEISPGEFEITVTPGPDTTVIEVTTPEEVITYPIGDFPITIPIIGTTPIIFTPINTGGGSPKSGPPYTLTIAGPIIYTMSGGLDLGGSPSLVLIGDPSGIYTLIPGKTNDTLYEREAGTLTEQDVKIPDPFIKTAFLGE